MLALLGRQRWEFVVTKDLQRLISAPLTSQPSLGKAADPDLHGPEEQPVVR